MSMRALLPSLPTLLVVIVTLVLLVSAQELLADFQTFISWLCPVMALFVVVLSQVFNQGRSGHLALLILFTWFLLEWVAPQPLLDAQDYWVFFWLALLWPVNVVLIRYLPEYRPISFGALPWPTLFLVQCVLLMILPQSPMVSDLYGWAQHWLSDENLGWLPKPAWVTTVLACGLLMTFLPLRNATLLALPGVVVLQALMFFFIDVPGVVSLVCASCLALMLCVILMHNHQLAYIDELTGLPGRRALMNDLRHRHGRYGLVMADIDHFKSFNDTHGHDVGDDVLRLVASQLAQVRGGRAYRYGGEEFTLIFPHDRLDECVASTNELREKIALYPLHVRNQQQRPRSNKQGKSQRGADNKGKVLHVTMSFGAALRKVDEDIDALMKRADKALYKAKQSGRNRVERAR